MVAADGDLSGSQAVALREYLMSGGWLIMPPPEDGSASGEVEELLQLKPSRSATLMAPEKPQPQSPLGAEEVRVLTLHPLLSGVATGSWLEWTGPAGKAPYSKGDEALPLLSFRRPELPAMRLISFGEGGVVHWNFAIRPGPLIEEMELKAFVGQTVAWLWGRASWAKPVEKEGTVPGVVRKKDGTAIPAAKVTAKVFSECGEAVQTLETTSSEDGKFSLSLFDNAIYWVKANAEGYYQADMYLLARPDGEKDEQIEVLMEQEGSIFGHAYYGPGEDHPAIGISVTLAPNCRISSAWEKETITDANARFSFDHLPAAQTFYLIAKAEGWMAMEEAPVPLDGGGSRVDVHLQSPTRVEGTTMNVVTEQPLPGVKIVARAQAPGIRRLFPDALAQTSISDEEGKFTLFLLPGYWEYSEYIPGFASVRSGGGIKVSDIGESEPPELRLSFCPAASLYGRIFRSSGEFAPGAKVTVSDVEYRADEKGEYKTVPTTPSVSGGRYAKFYVGADWNGESGSHNAIFALASVHVTEPIQPWMGQYETLLAGGFPIDVHLKRLEPEPEPSGTTVAGVVVDESGRPVASAVVELAEPSASDSESWGLSVFPRKRTFSGSEGGFAFSAVKTGLWLVRAQKKTAEVWEEISLYWGEEWLTVSEDTPVSGLQVKLGKAYVRGKVVSAKGTLLRDQYVSFRLTFHSSCSGPSRLYLGEHGDFDLYPGRFAVLTRPPLAAYGPWADAEVNRWNPEAKAAIPWEDKDLPSEGYVRLSPEIQSFPLQPLDVRLGEESIVIALPAMGSVRGRVVDARTGRPVGGADASIQREGKWLPRRTTDSEGAFSFDSVPVGPCDFYVNASGYYLPHHEQINVGEGQEYYIEANLGTYFIVRGRVRLRETGKPLLAEVRTKDGSHNTEIDGTFVLQVPREGNGGRYPFTVVPFVLPGTVPGLKSVDVVAPPPASAEHEVDVGDILIERESEEQKGSGNTGQNGET
ncbi:MAG: carboxypeptidase-like regulatory domain-containing protein, partial [bacterium]|nr:carboxypeptidase-like regulatory domain-containing protein [bacterium]